MSQFYFGVAILLAVHVIGVVAIVVSFTRHKWQGGRWAKPKRVNRRRAHHGVHDVKLRHVRLRVHADEQLKHGHVQARTLGSTACALDAGHLILTVGCMNMHARGAEEDG